MDDFKQFSSIILAGGRGRRVNNSDKGLVEFRGRPLIEHVLDRITPQVNEIAISANRNLGRYHIYGYPVITDTIEGYPGPLAGIASALPYCAHDWVLITPCDMPFLPNDLVITLYNRRDHHPMIAAVAGNRVQLVFLMRRELLVSIQNYLNSGNHKVMAWLQSFEHSCVDFSPDTGAFDNFNTPADLER